MIWPVYIFALVFVCRAHNNGAINFNINGQNQQLYVVSSDWAGTKISVDGTGLTLRHDARAYIASSARESLDADNYYQFSLLGKTLAYTVDLSTVGCSCNAALYFSSMPGFDSSGKWAPSEGGDFYCDANQVGGVWCWELDTFEANKYTMASTPHKCDSPSGQYIWNCDKGGCGTNAWYVDNNGMCPDSRCKIDTRFAFRHEITYEASNGKLTKIYNKLSQSGRIFDFTACSDSNYLSTMSDVLNKGMVLIFSLWGNSWSSMSWLDQMTGCSGDCNQDDWVKYSDFSISGSGPSPTPTQYEYGDICAHSYDGQCGSSCSASNCRWSWPQNDPAKWDSKDADCRCKPSLNEEIFLK